MATVTDMLAQLKQGQASLEEVAADFKTRAWPTATRASATTYDELAAREMDDPEPLDLDSWAAVELALTCGDITNEQYRALFAARQEAE